MLGLLVLRLSPSTFSKRARDQPHTRCSQPVAIVGDLLRHRLWIATMMV